MDANPQANLTVNASNCILFMRMSFFSYSLILVCSN
jgi:hypothetical protein